MLTLDRGDGWRDNRGGATHEEDRGGSSSREPSRDRLREQCKTGRHEDFNFQDGSRIKLSPKGAKDQFDVLKPEAMREFVRAYRVRFDRAQEQLKKATEKFNIWKEQVHPAERQRDIQERSVKACTQLLLGHDND